ncbi:hypothetical protein BD626DRAFT_479736 [Schizophyllum amplum]|uniref:Uncharacterized protein n=1 Tax=Schizophyllum amplum TaxID=97359 RepID=A0A550CSK5_9AGAR|nr:hypothetical protein BD626DRAFT_479736 [Auriculariopsis ampla]
MGVQLPTPWTLRRRMSRQRSSWHPYSRDERKSTLPDYAFLIESPRLGRRIMFDLGQMSRDPPPIVETVDRAGRFIMADDAVDQLEAGKSPGYEPSVPRALTMPPCLCRADVNLSHYPTNPASERLKCVFSSRRASRHVWTLKLFGRGRLGEGRLAS